MTDDFRERFEELCRELLRGTDANGGSSGEGIGTYNEKNLHRLLKKSLCDRDEECEVWVGAYVADILTEGHIIEIQTGSFYPLAPKLRYYLEETGYRVTVVHPLIVEKLLVRIDRETGEVLRRKKSPKRESLVGVLPQLYYLRQMFPAPGLELVLPEVYGEEYRYSERMRYRRAGTYDAEFFPTGIRKITTLSTLEDVKAILPQELRTGGTFDRACFSSVTGLHGREMGSALMGLCALGILESSRTGKKYEYRFLE